MRRVVAEAGAPELPADRSLTVIFPGVQLPPGQPPRADWMRRALVAARADPSLRAAAAAHRGEPDPGIPRTWLPVARTSSGLPLVAVAAVDQELVAYVSAAARRSDRCGHASGAAPGAAQSPYRGPRKRWNESPPRSWPAGPGARSRCRPGNGRTSRRAMRGGAGDSRSCCSRSRPSSGDRGPARARSRPVPPDASTPADRVRAIFERGRGRLLTRDLLHGVAAGALAVAAGIAVAPAMLIVVAAGLGIAATVVALRRHLRTTSRVAVLIERGDPALRNLVITAEELLRHPNRSAGWIGRRVFEDAAARLSAVDLGAAVPIGRAATAAVAAVALAALMPVVVRTIDGRAERQLPVVAGNPARGPSAIEVRLEPPSYSRRPPAVLTNPARIDALEGTRLTLVVTNPPGAVQVRFGDRQLPVSQRSDGPAIDLTLVESGYFAIESGHRETAREPVRLIAVAVTPDRAPDVRVERPGRDLLLPDVRAVVDVAAVAADDIGLEAHGAEIHQGVGLGGAVRVRGRGAAARHRQEQPAGLAGPRSHSRCETGARAWRLARLSAHCQRRRGRASPEPHRPTPSSSRSRAPARWRSKVSRCRRSRSVMRSASR